MATKRPKGVRVAYSPDPLDNSRRVGHDNELMEWLESLHDTDDPVAIIMRCEETDAEEGREPGTTLELYLFTLTNTH